MLRVSVSLPFTYRLFSTVTPLYKLEGKTFIATQLYCGQDSYYSREQLNNLGLHRLYHQFHHQQQQRFDPEGSSSGQYSEHILQMDRQIMFILASSAIRLYSGGPPRYQVIFRGASSLSADIQGGLLSYQLIFRGASSLSGDIQGGLQHKYGYMDRYRGQKVT